jgi:hypothetical protein
MRQALPKSDEIVPQGVYGTMTSLLTFVPRSEILS